MRVAIVAIGVVLGSSIAHAGGTGMPDIGDWSALVGPIIGIAWGKGRPTSVVYGVEGGGGHSFFEDGPSVRLGHVRLNVGVERRDGETFVYGELDPWLIVGATVGVGYGERVGTQAVLGVWEGVGVNDCSDVPDARQWERAVTISLAYRYTGMHELVIAPKYGVTRCLD